MKKALLIIFAVLIIAVIILTPRITTMIMKSAPDAARFDFEYIEVNGVKLAEDNKNFTIDVGDEGVDMWIEWINRSNDNRVSGLMTMQDVRMFIKNKADDSGWYNKDEGLRYETFHDQHIGEQREDVDIKLTFVFADKKNTQYETDRLVQVIVDWK